MATAAATVAASASQSAVAAGSRIYKNVLIYTRTYAPAEYDSTRLMENSELLKLSWALFAGQLGFANVNRFRIQIFKTKKEKENYQNIFAFDMLLVILLVDSAVAPAFP